MELALPKSFFIDRQKYNGEEINDLFKSTYNSYKESNDDISIFEHIKDSLLSAKRGGNLFKFKTYIKHLEVLSNSIDSDDYTNIRKFFRRNNVSACDCLNYIDSDDFLDEIGERECKEYFDIEDRSFDENDFIRDRYKQLDLLRLLQGAFENDLRNNDMVSLKHTINCLRVELDNYESDLKNIFWKY